MSNFSSHQRCSSSSSVSKRFTSSILLFGSSTFINMSVIMKMLCLLTKVGCVAQGEPTRFNQERASHQIIDQSENTLRYLSSLENETNFYHDLSHILKPRIPGTPGHKQVGNYIRNTMEELGWDVEEDKFIANAPRAVVRMKNIIATLDPSAPRRFVVACHYDSKIMREIFYGAIDSAVPCTMMLSLARTLHSHLKQHKNQKNRFTLQLIFFDGEEAFERWTATDSIYGSRHLASRWSQQPYSENPQRPNDGTTQLHRMDVMMLLDLLGTKNPTIPSYFSETKKMHSMLINIEKRLHRLGELKEHSSNYFTTDRSWGGIEDDHVPFWRKGVHILHIIPSPFPSVWHTVNDDENALHHATMINLNKIVRSFVSSYLGLESLIQAAV